MISKSEFIDWKNSPVTEQVFKLLQQRKDALVESLAETAGLNPIQDRYYAGYIAALNEVLLADWDEGGSE